jgi:hypothetical protein
MAISWKTKILSALPFLALATHALRAEPADAQPANAVPPASTLERAFIYAFPIYEMMRVRWNYIEDPNNPLRSGVNEIAHGRTLIDHTRRVVTTPNNDTVYSRTILDLSVGPVQIHVPDTNGRYYSLAFYDIFTNNFAYIGRRLTGTREGTYLVVGPHWNGTIPTPSRVIRAPSNDVLVLTRILVDGEADLPAAQAVQDGMRVAATRKEASARPAGIVPTPGDPAAFVAVVNQALSINDVPSYEQPLLKEFAEVGVCGSGCSWDRLPETIRARWKERFPAMLASLKKPLAGDTKPVDGWYYNPPQIGNFGTDYGYRAIVALNALLAMEPAEAVYPSAETDNRGDFLTGAHRYRLLIPVGGIPVDAFWSLSMYELMPDGRLFFLENPIKRYAIGDRTRGLKKNADGSIDILIQQDSPGSDKESNWLPAPKEQFKMVLRGYQPKAEMIDYRFRIPGVERVD